MEEISTMSTKEDAQKEQAVTCPVTAPKPVNPRTQLTRRRCCNRGDNKVANKRYKVLIIAGGGIFGEIPAKFLSMLPLVEQNLLKVDMLSGCSIGGILAAAYAAGHTFTEVEKIFREKAGNCFSKRFIARINPMACPTYDNDSIDKVLKEIIGDTKLGDVRKVYPKLDLVIPTLNLTDDQYHVFDNILHKDDDIPLAELGGLTSAAPSYYSGRDYNGKCYIDGGMIEVAPLLTATTALKSKRGVEFEDMDVLMLGTGYDIVEHPISTREYNGFSLLGMATKVIVPYVTLSNEMATRFWGNNIGYNTFNYFNPCVIDGKLDDVSQVPALAEQCEKYREDFLAAWYAWLNG